MLVEVCAAMIWMGLNYFSLFCVWVRIPPLTLLPPIGFEEVEGAAALLGTTKVARLRLLLPPILWLLLPWSIDPFLRLDDVTL